MILILSNNLPMLATSCDEYKSPKFALCAEFGLYDFSPRMQKVFVGVNHAFLIRINIRLACIIKIIVDHQLRVYVTLCLLTN